MLVALMRNCAKSIMIQIHYISQLSNFVWIGVILSINQIIKKQS